MKKTTIQISGMHCASCSLIIEKGLKKKEGIQKVVVNMATNSATIEFDETSASMNTIIKTIDSLGYGVTEQSDSHEMENYWRKFWQSALCTLPVATMMFVNWGSVVGEGMIRANSVFLLLTMINVLIFGRDFHDGFIKKAKQGKTNMDTLISIGTLVALIYSVYAYVQTYFFANPLDMGHFIMGANFIITFILLGKYFETKAKGNASQAIQKLLQLQEKEALVLRNGKEQKISIERIVLGDVVIVRAGDKIPVDGVIVSGSSDIDEAMLTGESVPVMKKTKDEVFTGTLVINGSLQIEVTKNSEETMLAKIIEVVNDAQSHKAPIQKLVDTISSYFVRGVLVIAVVTLIVWGVSTGNWTRSLLYCISVIVVACPCAMGLATPVAIMVASGKGASHGILIKSGEVLEKSKKIDVVVFDKTGTLTEGKPKVTDVIVIDGNSKTPRSNSLPQGTLSSEKNEIHLVFGREGEVLEIAKSLCVFSRHPLSKAVVETETPLHNALLGGEGAGLELEKGYSKVDIVHHPVELLENSFQEISGHGLVGEVVNKEGIQVRILVGNEKLLKKFEIEIDKHILQQIECLQEEGKTVNYVVYGKQIFGYIALLDVPKHDARSAVEGLQAMGIEVVMISGDTKKTVKAVAMQLGIDEYHAEVLPAGKADRIKLLQAKGKTVAFVGDGINDAPALAQSDLAIGIGQGSDIAIETADIVLMKGSPSKVVEAIYLSRKTYTIIKQNLFRAFGYNALLLPVAALGLLVPMYASLAMSLSSVSVVLNSLRIKR